MIYIYYLIYLISLIILFPLEYFKRPSELRKRWLMERMGRYTEDVKSRWDTEQKTEEEKSKTVIWVHAVSVGEVISVIPLIKRLYKDITRNIILSTVTDTGQEVARQRMSEGIDVVYAPFDLPFTINRLIGYKNPALLIIVETEIWPGIIFKSSDQDIPIMILNGRISDKSFKRYKKIVFFMRDVLKRIAFFGMQNQTYSGRIIEMGAEEDKVEVLGNLKFDTDIRSDIPEWTLTLKRPVIVAGSTHENEEEIILDAFKRLKKDYASLTLLLAPRHPERCKDIERLIKRKELQYIKRSQIQNSEFNPHIILLDTVGELSSVYGVADICIIGGSFVPKGGQNLLEPASWGKPIVCGPNMYNFPMTDEFIESGAAYSITAEGLFNNLKLLLSDGKTRSEMGSKAKELFKKNSGAIDRAMNEIRKVLNIPNI